MSKAENGVTVVADWKPYSGSVLGGDLVRELRITGA